MPPRHSEEGAPAPASVTFGPTFGIEEEVFVAEPTRPRLSSLFYLTRLLLRDPVHYYRHSAANFAWVTDWRECLFGAVEFATRPHASIEALLGEFRIRRGQLIDAVGPAHLVPVGTLFDFESKILTSGLHIHVGVDLALRERVYKNLARFLPLLLLASASSPFRNGEIFGPSWRAASSWAIGPLTDDPFHRLQDLIIARRLGTVEIRILDPVWDLSRLEWILRAVEGIVALPREHALDRAEYADLRDQAARRGYTPALQRLYQELSRHVALDEAPLQRTASDEIIAWVEQHGIAATYRALDSAYRHGTLQVSPPRPMGRGLFWKGLLGYLGYCVPRFPYTVYKQLRERGILE